MYMLKKVLKSIGIFLLGLILLFAILAVWLSITSSKHIETATPYLNKNVPLIATWDFEQLRPLLTQAALEQFETVQGQKIFKFFSKLGTAKSFDQPEFQNSKSSVTTQEGANEIAIFTMGGNFENGYATFTITLESDDYKYKIQHLKINSDAFIE